MAWTFNGVTKIISLDAEPVAQESVRELWTAWVDWVLTSDNSKYLPAMRVVGGDPLPGSNQLGLTYFLMNDWKIRPYESSHTFDISGNLYCEDGSSPYTNTIGSYNVMVISSVSNLVDSTVAQLDEIEYASYNGGITIDVVNGTDSEVYPYGTTVSPCKTLVNVSAISTSRGLKRVYALGNMTISGIVDGVLDSYEFVGNGHRSCTITINDDQLINCVIKNCVITGAFDDGSSVEVHDCVISNLSNISLDAHNCVLVGTIELNDTEPSNFYGCVDGVPGSGTPIIEVNDCEDLGIWQYSGGLKLTNIITTGTNISVNFNSGRLIVDSTSTTGSIIVRGVGSMVGTTGGTTVNYDGLIDKPSLADSVWDEATSGHTTPGTTGKAVSDIGSSSNPWEADLSGTFADGTAGSTLKKVESTGSDNQALIIAGL